MHGHGTGIKGNCSNRHEALRSTFTDDGKQICVYREMTLKLRYET